MIFRNILLKGCFPKVVFSKIITMKERESSSTIDPDYSKIEKN